jgi:hypothetical protein
MGEGSDQQIATEPLRRAGAIQFARGKPQFFSSGESCKPSVPLSAMRSVLAKLAWGPRSMLIHTYHAVPTNLDALAAFSGTTS